MRHPSRRRILQTSFGVGLGGVAGCIGTPNGEVIGSGSSSDLDDPPETAEGIGDWLPAGVELFAHYDTTAGADLGELTGVTDALGIDAGSIEQVTYYRLDGSLDEPFLVTGEFDPDRIVEAAPVEETGDGTYRGFVTASGDEVSIGATESVVVLDSTDAFETVVDTIHGDETALFEVSSASVDVLSTIDAGPVTLWIDAEAVGEHALSDVSGVEPTVLVVGGDAYDPGTLGVHLDGGPTDDAIGTVESELEIEHRDTDGEVVTFAVDDQFSPLERGGRSTTVAPKVAFDVSGDADDISILHVGGDSVDPESLSFGGDVVETDEAIDWTDVDPTIDGAVQAGDSVELTADDHDLDEDGGELAIIWSPPDSEDTSILALHEVPPAGE